jgi:hypothetical protein
MSFRAKKIGREVAGLRSRGTCFFPVQERKAGPSTFALKNQSQCFARDDNGEIFGR